MNNIEKLAKTIAEEIEILIQHSETPQQVMAAINAKLQIKAFLQEVKKK